MSESSAIDQISELRQEIAELESEVSALKESGRWISVNKELPKDAKPVLVHGGAAHYSHKYKAWFTNMERDNFGEYLPILWEVTHWMYFPLPPVEQGKL